MNAEFFNEKWRNVRTNWLSHLKVKVGILDINKNTFQNMKCVFHFEINLVESILAGRIIFLPYFLRRVSRDVFKLSFLSSIHWNIEYWTLSVVVRFLALRRIERIFSSYPQNSSIICIANFTRSLAVFVEIGIVLQVFLTFSLQSRILIEMLLA